MSPTVRTRPKPGDAHHTLWTVGLLLLACSRAPQKAPPVDVAPPARASQTIRCGAESCDVATQKCCMGKPSRCLPRTAAKGDSETYCELDGGVTGAIGCDESSDCPDGQRCCWNAADSENSFTGCAKACDLGVACRVDSDCPKEFVCGNQGQDQPGQCRVAKPQSPCGSELCRGDTPVCCYEPTNKNHRCVANDGSCRGGEVPAFAAGCATARDCGGEFCCVFYQSYCAASCINSQLACENNADCPKDYAGFALVGCQPTTDSYQPPWLKLCNYDSGAPP